MIAFRHAGFEALSALLPAVRVKAPYGTIEVTSRHVWEEQVALMPRSLKPPARTLRASSETEAADFASPMPCSRRIYVHVREELYVREAHRGYGVGTRLMAKLSTIDDSLLSNKPTT